jgi:phospholipase/carboxylesterase
MTQNPHGAQPIVEAGTTVQDAAGAMILLHGRGASSEDILDLGKAIAPENWAFMAPRAAGHTWYPYSFLAPREQNEPYLTSALGRIEAALNAALTAGISPEKVVVAGFSQGACLATEFIGRNPRRYGALLAFTGGLIGPLDTPLTLEGDLAGTAVLLSSGDPDPHVPWSRVQQSADLLRGIGGSVSLRRYAGRPHTIRPEEVRIAREMVATL